MTSTASESISSRSSSRGIFTEKQIKKRIIELTEKFAQLSNYIYEEPTISIYNVGSIPSFSNFTDWTLFITDFLVLCKVNPNWVMETKKLKSHLDVIHIHLISHCIKDKVVFLISNYIEENALDELNVYVTKNKS
jgi:hypothetical protein